MSRPVTGTYRLQLHAGFTFADAATQVPMLATLGVSHLYLSPILQAAPGSAHGYDVVDHTRVSADLGGVEGFRALVATAHEHDLGVVVDVVPNHMALPSPEHLNAPLWQVLAEGRDAPTAHWFDIDWKAGGGRLGLPVLGAPLEDLVADGQITRDVHEGRPVIRYGDHVLPLVLGSEDTEDLPELLSRQHYRLEHWRHKDEWLNYRRFFEVDQLIAVRVELDDVFDATHALLLELHHEGAIDGFRVDHPDGLADPTGYLDQLTAACRPGTPIWVEKILEGTERLPDDWRCAGTTGYDALRVVQAALTDPASAPTLDETWAATGGTASLDDAVETAKRHVVDRSLAPEVERLTRRAREALPGLAPDRLRAAVVEILVAGEVYRAYVRPDERPAPSDRERIDEAFERALASRPDLAAELDSLRPLTLLADDEAAATDFGVRLQQTWGPVMAKGIEDTTFYRWHRLVALNEVGSDPDVVADASPELMHDWARHAQAHWPRTMTTLSTHDTKRSEDVRARVLAASGRPQLWRRLSEVAASAADEAGVDRPTAHLVWQTLLGARGLTDERLGEYLTKAMREGKERTAWVDGDPEHEARVIDFATRANRGGPVREALDAAEEQLGDDVRAYVLAAKLLQLTLPGMPDVYQGCAGVDLSLVDPDNRRPVDFAGRFADLADLDASETDPQASLHLEKLHLTATALRLRHDHPELFGGEATYEPVTTGSEHVTGFVRSGRVAVLVTRAPGRLQDAGGWGDEGVDLSPGRWTDVLSGAVHHGGAVRCADAFAQAPVALLVLEETDADDAAAGTETAAAQEQTPADLGPHRVWAPDAEQVDLVRAGDDGETREPMAREEGGWWRSDADRVDGERYGFSLDGGETSPDPRSLGQPDGPMGLSQVVDTSAFTWTDEHWQGVPLRGAVIYELHVGTFTPEGTLDSAVERLDHLVDLGVTVVELMPVATYPGHHGWGYDGVDIWAVHPDLGGPQALARFVDAAHARGLAVCLDVVHNHLGPSGNTLIRFGPYFTDTHMTPWGPALNLDGPRADEVRRYLVDHSLMWLRDFHVDALRLDAVHALVDESAVHVLEQLAEAVDDLADELGRELLLVAESDRNDPATVVPRSAGGFGGLGLAGQWADDVHHTLHVLLTGETQGYYEDFTAPEALDTLVATPFFHAGTYSSFRGRTHGRPVDPERTPGWRFVASLQTHDQVGNRAKGDRLTHLVSTGRLACGAALLLCGPWTPMLFMGEEWGASTPWQYFTDHTEPELAEAVSRGRAAEFSAHGWGGDVPDPQSPQTYRDSQLRWEETTQEPHARVLEWYRTLVGLRRGVPDLSDADLTSGSVERDGDVVTMRRGACDVVVNLGTEPVRLEVGDVELLAAWAASLEGTTLVVPADACAVLRRS
ncbi:malto-oligosyltrehalose synthase [Janibacter melonis]|uniref:malto-oligosyltrehalose synthase n=1 Tax=Janibacter melonis TaxID=262209 RepID=UPI001F463AD2|nr:malto-oligosyltrehalose synthase [Janibacter melonis]